MTSRVALTAVLCAVLFPIFFGIVVDEIKLGDKLISKLRNEPTLKQKKK